MACSETRKTCRVEHEGESEAVEGRGRAKRGKSCANKLPQRGLGVAQLEKLRLQEQKMHETACFAATAGLNVPFFSALALAQKGNIYGLSYPYMQAKVEICNSLTDPNTLAFRPNLQNAATMPILMPMPPSAGLTVAHAQGASGDLVSASTLNQTSRSSLEFMLLDHEQRHEPVPLSFAPAVDISSPDSCLSSSISARDQFSGKSTCAEKENGKVATTESDAEDNFAFSKVDDLNTSSETAILKGYRDIFLYKSSNRTEKNALRGQEVQDSLVPALESSKELGYHEFLKRSAFYIPEANGQGILSNLQLLNSSFEPPDRNSSAVHQLHLPVMGISSFGNMPKELSSFQKFQSDRGQTCTEESSERKQPWLATQDSASFESKLMEPSSTGLGGFNEISYNQRPKVQTSDSELTNPAFGVSLHDLGNSAFPYLDINSSASIAAPICHEGKVTSFASGFCPGPLLLPDIKRNDVCINGYSVSKLNPETVHQEAPNMVLSVGTPNKLGYDFFLQNLGGGCSLQQDSRDVQIIMSQKDAIDEWKLNISYRKEQIDMPAPLSDTRKKSSCIMTYGKSEAFWSVEQSLHGAVNQHQSLDLTLKLAL